MKGCNLLLKVGMEMKKISWTLIPSVKAASLKSPKWSHCTLMHVHVLQFLEQTMMIIYFMTSSYLNLPWRRHAVTLKNNNLFSQLSVVSFKLVYLSLVPLLQDSQDTEKTYFFLRHYGIIKLCLSWSMTSFIKKSRREVQLSVKYKPWVREN